MKQIAIYIAAFLIVCACTSRSRYTAMRHALDSINTLNRTYRPFTPADIEPYVGYFDRHGNSNDRMLAHYLLGRAYHEQGEAPMALRCYQEAVTAADTTDEECDYAQLSRVCGQMAFLFYQQGLYNQVLPFNRKSVKYAWIAKDTLLALGNYEQESFIQMKKGNRSKSIAIIEDVAKRYTEYGHPSDAAISLGLNIKRLIDDGNYKKAKEYMDIYESKSGFFDIYGNIEKGREAYYEVKGLYFLNTNVLDSAEYYFRKELYEGKDFYNQHSAALGLMNFYKRQHRPDSIAKYAVYAYAMNDSLYAQRTAKELGHIQSMYNYSRYQEVAYKESAKADLANIRLLVSLTVLLAVFLATSWLYIARKKVLEKLSEMTEELKEIISENQALKQDAHANNQLMEKNSIKIDELKKKINKYEKFIIFGKELEENNLMKSSDYVAIKKLADKGVKLSEENWETLLRLSNEYYPGFCEYILSQMRYGSRDFKVCHLLRMHFKVGEIANMLGVTPPYISKTCTEILFKLFYKKGSSKDLYQKLKKIK